MQTSNAGIALIKQHEGLRLDAYPDPAHGWKVGTIGYGHTSAAGPPGVVRGMRITGAEADAILRNDLRKFEGYVSDAVRVPLTQPQFDALVSFCFNLGPGNLRSSTLLRKLNAGDYQGAANEFGKWVKAGGKTLPGLVTRRAAERALFMSGNAPPAPKPGPVMPKPVIPPAAPQGGATATIAIVAALVAVVGAVLFILKG